MKAAKILPKGLLKGLPGTVRSIRGAASSKHEIVCVIVGRIEPLVPSGERG
jgi:hypothetical protein